MVNTIKFSEFLDATLSDDTNLMVGVSGTGSNRANMKSPFVVTWTTATRPVPPFNGLLGFNTDTQLYEFYDAVAAAWVPIAGGADILPLLASHDPGEGASLIGLEGTGTVQDLSEAKFIVQVANAATPNAQSLGALTTGILKSTTATGVLSISAPLTSIDGLATVANKMLYTTGVNTYATTDLTAFSRTLLADTTAAAWAATLLVLPLSGGTMTGMINMGGFRITNMMDPVAAQDAATKAYVDSGAFLPLSGGTMSGQINMGGFKIVNMLDPTNPQDAATRAFVLSQLSGYLPTSGGTMSGQIDMGNQKIVNMGNPTLAQDAVTLFYLSNQLTNYLPLAGGTMALNTGNINMNSSSITNLDDPINPQDAATKAYVDLVATGLTVQAACYAATTANLNAIYANGAAGIGATLTNNGALAAFSVDGVSPPINSRILVKDQSTTFQNGIYTLTTVGSGAVAWVLTRATDYDQPSEINPGDFVIVNNGTTNGGASWIETATVATIGTDPILFSQFTFSATAVLLKANNLNDVANTTSAFNNISPTTTKGDIIVDDGTNDVRLAVGGTNGQVLMVKSSTSTGLVYSTATYPETTTINQILYSSSANVVAGISSVNGGVLKTNSTGIPAFLANPAATGRILQSVNADSPAWSTPTYPSASGATGKILISDGTNVVYSTPTYPNSSVTAGKILISDGTNFVASTPTYPNSSVTAGKILISDGTNFVASTPTYPNSSASAGKILISDGTNFIASTPTYPNASASAGKILISDGTNFISSTPTYPNASASAGKILISDGTNFISSTPTYPNASASSGKILVSDGTNFVASTPTYPNASATSGKIITSDGTNFIASAYTVASPGTSGNILTSDGTNWTSAAPASGGSVTSVATAGLATGGPITTTGTVTVTAAVQSDQETATSTTVAVVPGVQQYHPSSAKSWVFFTSVTTTTINASYNVTSLTDGGTGITTVNIGTDFSSANYASVFKCDDAAGNSTFAVMNNWAAGSIACVAKNSSSTNTDMSKQSWIGFGDQ